MKTTNSLIARKKPLALDEKNKLQAKSNNTQPLVHFNPQTQQYEMSPVLQLLKKKNPLAALGHLILHKLFTSIVLEQVDGIEKAKQSLLTWKQELTTISRLPGLNLTKEEIGNFYGVKDAAKLWVHHLRTKKELEYCYPTFNSHRIGQLMMSLDDVVAVAMAIADGRVIYFAPDFCITYGVSNLERRGELLIAIYDGQKIWSFDKDSERRVSISSLRAAKKAMQQWRGANILGEVTHDEAQRLADFFGLIPVQNTKRQLVMLTGSQKLVKGFGK